MVCLSSRASLPSCLVALLTFPVFLACLMFGVFSKNFGGSAFRSASAGLWRPEAHSSSSVHPRPEAVLSRHWGLFPDLGFLAWFRGYSLEARVPGGLLLQSVLGPVGFLPNPVGYRLFQEESALPGPGFFRQWVIILAGPSPVLFLARGSFPSRLFHGLGYVIERRNHWSSGSPGRWLGRYVRE